MCSRLLELQELAINEGEVESLYRKVVNVGDLQVLAIDLLNFLPTMSPSMLAALLLLCSEPTRIHHSLLSRLVRVLCARCDENNDERPAVLEWLAALLSLPSTSLKTALGVELVKAAAMGLAQIAGNLYCRGIIPTLTSEHIGRS